MVRALWLSAAVILVVAGCGSEEEPSEADSAPIVVPTFSTAAKPAADCFRSDLTLPVIASDEGVVLEASTDDTGTSLLLKNAGTMTVLVIPDEDWSTRVTTAPHANPTDAASKAALVAVNRAGGLQSVEELPVGIPASQVFVVPPQWAICGLTDDASKVASLRYLRDRTTSAEYFVTKGLADQLLARKKQPNQTLLRCARETQQLLKTRPDLQDLALYTELLTKETGCRSSLKALLSDSERTTEQTSTRVLDSLQLAPSLPKNPQPAQAFAHR